MAYYGYSTQTPAVYTEWVKCLCNNTELEHAIDVIDKMKREDIRPSLHTYMPVIHAAIGLGHPDVALQYFEEGKETYLRLSRGAEDLPEHLRPLIVRVLRCAAYAGSYEIVKTTWDLAVNKQKYMPDEGLCYYVLNVAAQQGDPTLGLDVIRTIGAQGLPYKEAHFSALVEAYAATEDWKSTLRIFHVMRKAGVIPRRNTAQSMLAKFAMDPEAVHAARNALRKLSEEKQADVVAFNLLIHSYANNGDYDSAMGLFDTLKEQNIAFDSDTVDSLLDACIHAKRYDEGAAIYRKYVDGEHIKATPRTLSKMVALACTQDDYEDAFTYLEETKAMKMVPLRGTYYRLIKKLASCNDTRLESAIQEMKACGYEISTFMREHLEKHSKQESEEEASTSTPAVASNGL
ncbi:hypothetical protein BX666DRAFT_392232 [Dichotomocladium elegans]|nr:hypothetical protein BX666DRAFT_392232 [Dichotomocladium elegans]